MAERKITALRIIGLLLSIAFSILCGTLGYSLSRWYLELPSWIIPPAIEPAYTPGFESFITIAFITLGTLAGFAIASVIFRQISELAENLASFSSPDKIAALVGLIMGLLVAGLLRPVFDSIAPSAQLSKPALLALIYILCIYGGISISLGMRNELTLLLTRPGSFPNMPPPDAKMTPKLLDTNVIIDGRITDICRAGFIEGIIYIPGFVLEELQLIADSSDNLRRARGRRGLDILSQLQKDMKSVQVYDRYKTKMAHNEAVDSKLVKLAKELEAAIITNDFNLNKVASLQGITVMNINELASALKPIVLPGEELTVTIVREGKELNQGVAYLDDGTMVVVEGAKTHINESIIVIVSSVLQTVAGKMIFANLKPGGNRQASRDYSESDNSNQDNATKASSTPPRH